MFVSNVLGLEFFTSDGENSICSVEVSNVLELFFYFKKGESSTNYTLTMFQPDILVRSVNFDDGRES